MPWFPQVVLEKKNNTIAYRQVRKAIAAKVTSLERSRREENGIQTKHLYNENFYYSLKKWFFYAP